MRIEQASPTQEILEWIGDTAALQLASFKAFRRISSLFATNPLAVREILQEFELPDRNAVVVEAGIARGTITRALLRKEAKDDTIVIGIELHKPFADSVRTQIADDRLEVIHGSISDIAQIMEERRLKADLVISGIPHSRLEKSVLDDTLEQIRDQVLKLGGKFVVYNFVSSAYYHQQATFGAENVTKKRILKNLLPPLVVSTATKPEPNRQTLEEYPDKSPGESRQSTARIRRHGCEPPTQHLDASA